MHYIRFLCAVFREANTELDRLGKQDTYESLARSWREHLETDGNRNRFHENAVQSAWDIDVVSGICFAFRHNLSVSQHAIQHKYHPLSPKTGDVSVEGSISLAAEDALAKLLRKMASCCNSQDDFMTSGDVKIMLYFDEAHVLAVESDVERGPDGDNYDVLCSCLNLFMGYPFFVIFLSTSSCLSHMAPQGPQARSARARHNPEGLQAPIIETPFDCWPTFPLKPGDLMLHDLYRMKTLASFGRPM